MVALDTVPNISKAFESSHWSLVLVYIPTQTLLCSIVYVYAEQSPVYPICWSERNHQCTLICQGLLLVYSFPINHMSGGY